ncbi:CEP95 protein, partial [Aegotheles bennettii]|nr:CEP95 protein [Aegotheles bennettii]
IDWVDVANVLLRSCHINQRIKNLSECGADVFVRFYESILGEKVPDFIAAPRSQENDAHNVQAVIDSLALDYLQVSLSHITGENIVKGEKESIINLLEIFDILLEYLIEEASEYSSQNGDEANVLPNYEVQIASQEQLERNAGPLLQPSIFSSVEGSQSESFVSSDDVDGSESASELIRLGDTAYSFSKREEGSIESVHTTEPQKESLNASATKLGEPIQQAIPLLPPFQPSEARPHYFAWRDYQSSASQSAAWANSQGVKIPTDLSTHIIYGISELYCEDLNKMLIYSYSFSQVPQVYGASTSASSLHPKLSLHAEQVTRTPRPEPRYLPRKKRQVQFFKIKSVFCFSRYENSITDSLREFLPHGTTTEKLSEQELPNVSERLSRRLNELNSMLKRALDEHSREEELTDEDSLSQHSDSVMDYHQREAEQDTPHLRYPRLLRSPSPSSSRPQLFSELEDELCSNGTGQIRKIQSQLQKESDERTKKTKVVAKAYEDELRIYEARERLGLPKLGEVSKEMEQGYKENIFKEPPKMPQPVKVYSSKTTPRNPKYSQWIPKQGTVKPKKAAPMKVGDGDLLFQLLEEFPHLHISHHTMKKMWQQQLAHTEQLKAASGRTRPKLQNEVQQALKRNELLVRILKKDQEHNKRLQEFKQHIRRQKWAQNKVREKCQQVARARKYYEDYRVQLRAKMMRARTREERIFKNLFEEGLEIQKQRLKDLRAYAQEKRAEQVRKHQNELESMENYYKNQFSMLAEALAQEHQEIRIREKAQAQMLQKNKREFRSRMEKEIQQLQAAIVQRDDDTFFQELEADRLKSRLQMASFQYGKSRFL